MVAAPISPKIRHRSPARTWQNEPRPTLSLRREKETKIIKINVDSHEFRAIIHLSLDNFPVVSSSQHSVLAVLTSIMFLSALEKSVEGESST